MGKLLIKAKIKHGMGKFVVSENKNVFKRKHQAYSTGIFKLLKNFRNILVVIIYIYIYI